MRWLRVVWNFGCFYLLLAGLPVVILVDWLMGMVARLIGRADLMTEYFWVQHLGRGATYQPSAVIDQLQDEDARAAAVAGEVKRLLDAEFLSQTPVEEWAMDNGQWSMVNEEEANAAPAEANDSGQPKRPRTRVQVEEARDGCTCVVCGATAVVVIYEVLGRAVVNVAPACGEHEARMTSWELLAKGDNPTWGVRDRGLG